MNLWNNVFIYNIFMFLIWHVHTFIYTLCLSDIVLVDPLSRIKIKYDLLLTNTMRSSEIATHLHWSVTYKCIEIICQKLLKFHKIIVLYCAFMKLETINSTLIRVINKIINNKYSFPIASSSPSLRSSFSSQFFLCSFRDTHTTLVKIG